MKNKVFRDFSSQADLNLFHKYFKFHEFDSPDQRGSGEKFMDRNFLLKLSRARQIANVAFKITSGYRTQDYNRALLQRGYKASLDSSHCKGIAVDIAVTSSRDRFIIVNALIAVGFTRIGIGNTFIHVDMDMDKPQDSMWTY